jgi:predicted RNase H-like nuclease
MEIIVGIDGCRSGWAAAVIKANDWIGWEVFADLKTISDTYPTAQFYIDIPIGLAETGGGRICDSMARQHLGSRRASIFTPPVRQLLSCSTYPAALALSRQLIAKGISKQCFNILPKIREADSLLQLYPAMRKQWQEAHPELIFYGLNGEKPLTEAKKTAAGKAARLALLKKFHAPAAEALSRLQQQSLPAGVNLDDIIDAGALAIAAGTRHLKRVLLPSTPIYDSTNLAMQLCYFTYDTALKPAY